MSTTHTIRTLCPFGLDAIDVEITYTYIKGSPARGPSYASGGEPADPPEVDFVSANPVVVVLDNVLQSLLGNWAREYIVNEGFDECCEQADADSEDRT